MGKNTAATGMTFIIENRTKNWVHQYRAGLHKRGRIIQ